MPVGGLLVGVGCAQNRQLVEGFPAQLQADGKPFVGEPAGTVIAGNPLMLKGRCTGSAPPLYPW